MSKSGRFNTQGKIFEIILGEKIYQKQIKKLSNGVNAVIHKDYTGAPIQLSVYNNRLILWNEGRLPEDFTIETLLRKHPSRPYNKNIAGIFFKAGFIEAWGRGIAKIINGFKNADLPIPIFQATMGGILVTISRSTKIQHLINERVNERVNSLQKTERSILLCLKEDQGLTQKAIAEKLNLTEQYVRKMIKRLKDMNLISRVGSNKTGYWKIID